LTKAYEPTPGAPGAGGRQETAPGRFWRAAVARKLHRVASGDAEIVKARSKRWAMLAEDMIEWEETGLEMLRLHREWWAGRWDTLRSEDATTLREAERDMVAFFGREVGEIDKRCWMVDHGYATVGQDQISGLRKGTIPRVEWTGKGRDKYGEESRVASGWRQ
ncbi:hypothetical protein Q9L58_010044, partial [Maublancomyces gigas]